MRIKTAVSLGHVEITRILLQCGVNPDIKDTDGKTAWDYAKDKRIISAILEKYLNDVVAEREFPPCYKIAK